MLKLIAPVTTYSATANNDGGSTILVIFNVMIPTLYNKSVGWQDSSKAHTLTSELSSLGMKPDPAVDCQPDISQAERGINVCDIPYMDT